LDSAAKLPVAAVANSGKHVVSVASFATVTVAASVALPAVRPDAVPVMFVPTSADGVPRSPLTSASVPVASGSVMTRPAVETASSKVIALAALDEERNRMPLAKSVPSEIVRSPLPFGCRCIPMFALAPSART
jgi:hypothetical protein